MVAVEYVSVSSHIFETSVITCTRLSGAYNRLLSFCKRTALPAAIALLRTTQ